MISFFSLEGAFLLTKFHSPSKKAPKKKPSAISTWLIAKMGFARRVTRCQNLINVGRGNEAKSVNDILPRKAIALNEIRERSSNSCN